MSKVLKQKMGQEIAESLRPHDSCVVVGLQKLDVEGSNRLRGKLADEDAHLTIVQNRIARHALTDVGWGDLGPMLEGSSAIAYGGEGAVPISRILVEWERAEKSIVLKGAYIDGEALGEDGVRRLATIPDRLTLLAQILAGIQGPMTGLARVINGVATGLVTAMSAIAEQKEDVQAEG
jgi:large subunit ribosomal protein L10